MASSFGSILVSNAPTVFFKKRTIRNHFSRYGFIVHILVGGKSYCVVTFEKAESANAARDSGKSWKSHTLVVDICPVPAEAILPEEPQQLAEELSSGSEVAGGSRRVKIVRPEAMEAESLGKRKSEDLRDDEVRKFKLTSFSAVKQEDLFGKLALSPEEKLNILEERDRLLRIRLEKSANLTSPGTTKGTCPDMCPEKERILREVRRMVAPYEASESGSMIHSLAVKEYTRSSADQDEPLPHELRPEPVLTMTMEYLITNIMGKIDNDEDNLSTWYDFCWGRLRAIRKDIVQQQLYDLSTTKIVEQCARFHIVCYDRLWGVRESVFDEKINSENLMNCLQSLTYMYDDLKKHNVFSTNEAEFKSYLILLKLTSSFVFSEFQKFQLSVQRAPQVIEAIKIHMAFHNNMYASYFAILQRTSYLNACLMQRFLGQVRSKALEIIVRAYCHSNKSTRLPITFINETLKFDNEEDCISFCELFGMTVSHDGLSFLMSRSELEFPESVFFVSASSDLVVRKRVPVPEAVLGGDKFPEFVEHDVHSSFSEDHLFKSSAIDASDQEEKMLRDIVERKLILKKGHPISTSKSPSLSPKFHNIESIATAPPVVVEEKTDCMEVDVKSDITVEKSDSSSVSSLESDSEEHDSSPMAPSISSPLITAKTPYTFTWPEAKPHVPIVEIPLSKPSPVSPVSPKPNPLTIKQKKEQENKLMLSKLRKKLSEKMKHISARKYARLWKTRVEKIKEDRRAEASVLRRITPQEFLDVWGSSRHVNFVQTAKILSERKRANLLVRAILQSNFVDYLDKGISKIGQRIADILGSLAEKNASMMQALAHPTPVFWKVVFALPERLPVGSTFPTKLNLWCQKVFLTNEKGIVCRRSTLGISTFINVQIVEGFGEIEKRCGNLSSLIVVSADGWETAHQTQSRLDKILRCVPHQIPVAFLSLSSDSTNLNIDSEKVSYFSSGHWQTTDDVVQALVNLASRSIHFNLKVLPAGELISDVSEKFFDALHEDRYLNDDLDTLLCEPNNIITFYNNLIDRIHQEVLDSRPHFQLANEFKDSMEAAEQLANFPDSFPDFEGKIFSLMNSLKLGPFAWPFQSSRDLLSSFRNYCEAHGCSQVLSKIIRMINPPDDDKGVDLTSYLKQSCWLLIIETLTACRVKSDLISLHLGFRYDRIIDMVNSHWWLNESRAFTI